MFSGRITHKLCGTYFYEVKKKDSKYFLNPNNIEVTMDNLEEFYNDSDLISKKQFNNKISSRYLVFISLFAPYTYLLH